MKLWQIVAVVAAGIACGFIAPGRFTYAFGHATLYVFLPPLLFEAAWNLHYKAIVRNWAAIATLAGPGVVLTSFVVAGALLVTGVPFGPAFLTGAILSATDPIAIVAVFRRLKVPRTLATIVECESLFNDAVAVVLYRLVLAILAAGALAPATIAWIAIGSLAGAAGGIILGIALAFGLAGLLRGRSGTLSQVAATLVCAYGAYFAADALHLSGIFATIAAGIALRYYERRWLSLTIAQDVYWIWGLAATAANVLVFFLVGAALDLKHAAAAPAFVIACVAGVAVARIAVAAMLLPSSYPRGWLAVVRVAGMRGALSLALAIALPASVPYREAIVVATFAVAIATLAASALTVTGVVKAAASR